MRQKKSTDAAALRRRAEERLREKRNNQQSQAEKQRGAIDAGRLLHELEVHQIELEQQNEELLQARDEREALLARYADLYEFAPAGYPTLDREGTIRQVNLTGALLLGVERSLLVGQRFVQFVAESERRTFNEFLRRVFAGEAKERCEVTLSHDGSLSSVVQIEASRPDDVLECRMMMVDISSLRQSETRANEAKVELNRLLTQSEQSRRALLSTAEDAKTAEQTLRASEVKYRDLFDNAEVAMFRSRLDGSETLDANRKFLELVGRTREQTLGQPSVILWADPNEHAEMVRRLVANGSVSEYEFQLQNREKGVRNCLTSLRLYREEGILVGSIVDNTERLQAAQEKTRLEDQLRQSQKVEAIGQLAGGVAHDFNNLTAIVLGYGEMLLDKIPPDDPRRTYAEQIVAAGKRSAALTRQLLAFSRKQTLQPEVLNLNDLLRHFEQMLGRLIGENIRLELRLAADPGRVKADPGQLEQVITNLAVNARDAMPLGGALTLETADVDLDETFALDKPGLVPGSYVLLALTDTGCGMDKATLARLFEPFFTTKPQGKGTGLGLATVYGIVKQSGGYIGVVSEPGAGSTFRVYLPRTAAPVVARAVVSGEEPPGGSGERILLVEDEAPLRELCVDVLSRHGYRVSAAADGAEAVRLVLESGFEPDLVVTDVVMPGMSGTEMAERLRRGRPGLPVLYMSGYPDEILAPHGVLEPDILFMQKPFTARTLAAKVGATLAGKAAAALPGRRILMIDDDEQFRELVRHFCTKAGHEFHGVDSAAAALEALATRSFDVLLVDLNIPGTDGEHVLREIRAAGHAAPAIVLTGDVASAAMDVLRPLGAVLALQKSSEAESLLQAIEAVAATGGTPPDRL